MRIYEKTISKLCNKNNNKLREGNQTKRSHGPRLDAHVAPSSQNHNCANMIYMCVGMCLQI